MTWYTAGTVLRYTREFTLGARTFVSDRQESLFFSREDVELSDPELVRHIEVVFAPLQKFQAGDVVRDGNGVTWCRASGFEDDRWYIVHNHPGTDSELIDRADRYNTDVDRDHTLVRTDELPKPITPVLRNGFPWKDDE